MKKVKNFLKGALRRLSGRRHIAAPVPVSSASESNEDKCCVSDPDESLPQREEGEGGPLQQSTAEVVLDNLLSAQQSLQSTGKCHDREIIGELKGCASKKPPDPDYMVDVFHKFHSLNPPPPPYSPNEAPEFQIPSKYALKGVKLSDRSLGAGNYRSVVLASYHGTPVAAKSMQPISRESARYSWKHGYEIEVLSEIKHPNILQFLGTHTEDSGAPYLIMEYLEDGSLYDLVGALQANLRRVSLSQKFGISIGINRALEYLHNVPLLHRNLSSSNVLLTKELRVKVTGFGMCSPFTSKPSTLSPGCYLYMPQEALRPDGVFTNKADISSLAVIMMELINECHPRVKSMEVSEHDRRMQDVRDFISKAPTALHGLVMHCLHDDPQKRPSAKDISAELEDILKSLPEDRDELDLLSTKLQSSDPHQETGSGSQFVYSSEGPRVTPRASLRPNIAPLPPLCEDRRGGEVEEQQPWEMDGPDTLFTHPVEQESKSGGQALVLAPPFITTEGEAKSEMVTGDSVRYFLSLPHTLNFNTKASQSDHPVSLENALGGEHTQTPTQALPPKSLSPPVTPPSNRFPFSNFLQEVTLACGHLLHRELQSSTESISKSISYPDKDVVVCSKGTAASQDRLLRYLANLVLQHITVTSSEDLHSTPTAVTIFRPSLCSSREIFSTNVSFCTHRVLLGRFKLNCGYLDIVVILRGNVVVLFAMRIILVGLKAVVQCNPVIALPHSTSQSTASMVVALSCDRQGHMCFAMYHVCIFKMLCHVFHCFCNLVSRAVSTLAPTLPFLSSLSMTNGCHCVYTVFLSRSKLPCGYLDVVVVTKGGIVVIVAMRIIVIGLIPVMGPPQLKAISSKWIALSSANHSPVCSHILRVLCYLLQCFCTPKYEAIALTSQSLTHPSPSPFISSSTDVASSHSHRVCAKHSTRTVFISQSGEHCGILVQGITVVHCAMHNILDREKTMLEFQAIAVSGPASYPPSPSSLTPPVESSTAVTVHSPSSCTHTRKHCTYTVLPRRIKIPCGFIDVVVVLREATVVLFALRVAIIVRVIVAAVETSQPEAVPQNTSKWGDLAIITVRAPQSSGILEPTHMTVCARTACMLKTLRQLSECSSYVSNSNNTIQVPPTGTILAKALRPVANFIAYIQNGASSLHNKMNALCLKDTSSAQGQCHVRSGRGFDEVIITPTVQAKGQSCMLQHTMYKTIATTRFSVPYPRKVGPQSEAFYLPKQPTQHELRSYNGPVIHLRGSLKQPPVDTHVSLRHTIGTIQSSTPTSLAHKITTQRHSFTNCPVVSNGQVHSRDLQQDLLAMLYEAVARQGVQTNQERIVYARRPQSLVFCWERSHPFKSVTASSRGALVLGCNSHEAVVHFAIQCSTSNTVISGVVHVPLRMPHQASFTLTSFSAKDLPRSPYRPQDSNTWVHQLLCSTTPGCCAKISNEFSSTSGSWNASLFSPSSRSALPRFALTGQCLTTRAACMSTGSIQNLHSHMTPSGHLRRLSPLIINECSPFILTATQAPPQPSAGNCLKMNLCSKQLCRDGRAGSLAEGRRSRMEARGDQEPYKGLQGSRRGKSGGNGGDQQGKHFTAKINWRHVGRIRNTQRRGNTCSPSQRVHQAWETTAPLLAPGHFPYPPLWRPAPAYSIRGKFGLCHSIEAHTAHTLPIEGVCSSLLPSAVKANLACLTSVISPLPSPSPLPPPKPKPECLPLNLKEPVRVVSSPQSGDSTTTTGGGSGGGGPGTSGGGGDNSGGGPTETSGGGAGHTPPGGGGDKDGNDGGGWKRGDTGDPESEEEEEEEESETEDNKEDGWHTERKTGKKAITEELLKPGHLPVGSKSPSCGGEKSPPPRRTGGDLITQHRPPNAPQSREKARLKKQSPRPPKLRDKSSRDKSTPPSHTEEPGPDFTKFKQKKSENPHNVDPTTAGSPEDQTEEPGPELTETKADEKPPPRVDPTTAGSPEGKTGEVKVSAQPDTTLQTSSHLKPFVSNEDGCEDGDSVASLEAAGLASQITTESVQQTHNPDPVHTDPYQPTAPPQTISAQAPPSPHSRHKATSPIQETSSQGKSEVIVQKGIHDHLQQWYLPLPPAHTNIPLLFLKSTFTFTSRNRHRLWSSFVFYDAQENLDEPGAAEEDGAGEEEEVFYDAQENLDELEDGAGEEEVFYDAQENLDELEDGAGEEDEVFYDALEYLDEPGAAECGAGEDTAVAVEGSAIFSPGLTVAGQQQPGALEEALQATEDTPTSSLTMVVHQPPPPVTYHGAVAEVCTPTEDDVEKMFPYEPRAPLGPPFSRIPSLEGPSTIGQDLMADSHATTPFQESPFLPRLYQELRQNGVNLVFTTTEVQGMPLELYLEQALQNGNFAFAVEVLSRLLNCMRICSLWGAPFSLHADEVYVDVETHQLTVNAAVCIAANVQCGPVVMEESVGRLRLILQRLLFIISENNNGTNHQIVQGVNLLRGMLDILGVVGSIEDQLETLLTALQQYM